MNTNLFRHADWADFPETHIFVSITGTYNIPHAPKIDRQPQQHHISNRMIIAVEDYDKEALIEEFKQMAERWYDVTEFEVIRVREQTLRDQREREEQETIEDLRGSSDSRV